MRYGMQYDENGAPMVQLTPPRLDRAHSVIRLPAFEKVRNDKALYAHASRVLHLETNPGNARALVQKHADVDLWLNPPPLPLEHGGDGLHFRYAVCARAASRLSTGSAFPPGK